jgi:hypothetical protein
VAGAGLFVGTSLGHYAVLPMFGTDYNAMSFKEEVWVEVPLKPISGKIFEQQFPIFH